MRRWIDTFALVYCVAVACMIASYYLVIGRVDIWTDLAFDLLVVLVLILCAFAVHSAVSKQWKRLLLRAVSIVLLVVGSLVVIVFAGLQSF